jgi:glutathione-regulated potassium-efflux system ancillary protein KefC
MLVSAFIYLLAAVVAVPFAKRLGLGSVLGYLLAGIIIGPSALHLVGDQTDVMHVAEFGVVMMLFLVGLELQPSRLWSLRKPILGLGGLQVALTATAITLSLHFWTSLALLTCLAIGLALALSSTAIVIQSLSERGQLDTPAGRNAFSVLLFQDIAVIPILALFPLLATMPASNDVAHHPSNLLQGMPTWVQVGASLGSIALIVLIGRYALRPIFRFIADTNMRELFTAFALLLVVGIALAMSAIGLSAALGTFLAGVVLAESEFRHEIEVDIAPFKSLLLGLFFITVGANIDFAIVASNLSLICVLVVALITIKALVLFGLSQVFRMGKMPALLFTVALAQGGEFAFVLASAGLQFSVFDAYTTSLITIVVALSMLIAPLLFVLFEAYANRVNQEANIEQEQDVPPTCDVIIAGYGRFGQIIGRFLSSAGYDLTILDHSASQIEMVRRFGSTVYYGDAARADLLAAAGARNAKLLVVGVDDVDKSLEIVRTAKKHFPSMKIVARAVDRRHTYELLAEDVAAIRREVFHPALELGVDALKILGRDGEEAERMMEIFSEHDQATLLKLADVWGDDQSYGRAIRQQVEDLRTILMEDAARNASRSDESSD